MVTGSDEGSAADAGRVCRLTSIRYSPGKRPEKLKKPSSPEIVQAIASAFALEYNKSSTSPSGGSVGSGCRLPFSSRKMNPLISKGEKAGTDKTDCRLEVTSTSHSASGRKNSSFAQARVICCRPPGTRGITQTPSAPVIVFSSPFNKTATPGTPGSPRS